MNRTTVFFLLIAFILFSAVVIEAATAPAPKSKAATKTTTGAAKTKAATKTTTGAAKTTTGAAKTTTGAAKTSGAGPSKAAAPQPSLNTRLVGMKGKKTGMVVKHIIRNVGTVPVSGIASEITIGVEFQFYQFRNHSDKVCTFASNVVKCAFKLPLPPKGQIKTLFTVAPKGLVIKDAEVTKAAAKTTTGTKKTTTGTSKTTTGAKKTTTGAAKTTGAAVPSTVPTVLTGWKAVVTATGISYPISAPLHLKPKKPLTM